MCGHNERVHGGPAVPTGCLVLLVSSRTLAAMPTASIPPMTLGNMRANGVRSLLVYCVACHRDAVFNVDAYGDDVPVPAFSPRMVCTRCGMVGADARPNWNEHRPAGTGR